MHYGNGREAKNGDTVVFVPKGWGRPVIGILYDATAGNDSCNGRIAIATPNDIMPNLAECMHIDDAKALLEPKQEEAPKAPEAAEGQPQA